MCSRLISLAVAVTPVINIMGKARRRAEEAREKEVGIIVEKQEKI